MTPLIPESKFITDGKNVGDGLLLLKDIIPETITAAFFDPQYRGILDKLKYGNEGVKRGRARSALTQMSIDAIIEFMRGIDRALIKSGHVFLWVDKFHLCEGVKPWLIDTELEIVDMLVWDKARMGMGYRTRRRAEYLIVLQKRPKRAKGIWNDHGIPDVFCEPAIKGHPHRKPHELQSKLIAAVTNKGDWVLDPAAGSYVVLDCCLETGRRFLGCDIGEQSFLQ